MTDDDNPSGILPVSRVSAPTPKWVLLRKAVWPFRRINRQMGLSLSDVGRLAGTWHDVRGWKRREVQREGGKLLAFYCCPECQELRALVEFTHRVDDDGKVSLVTRGDWDGRCSEFCTFARPVILDRWNPKRVLYAIAWEAPAGRLDQNSISSREPRKVNLSAGINYVHASEERGAREQYFAAHDPRHETRIVGIGPAIGFFVRRQDEDKEKRVLIA